MSRRTHVMVLDVGSSSTRCWFFDDGARGIDPGPEARVRYGWTVAGGAMAMDADRLLEHVAATVDGALAHARSAGIEIAAVGVTSFWHSVVGLDHRGEPVTPLTGWGDSRAAATAARLSARIDASAYHGRTGCFLHASYPLVRLTWLRETDPALWSTARSWVSFAEYLERRLFGVTRCSISMASGTGLLHAHRLAWDEEALEIAGVSADALSPVVEFDEPVMGLSGVFAARWPELARVPWYPATGDGACANLGSGAVGARRHGVTIGTTAAVRVLVEPGPDFQIPPALWAYRLDAGQWAVGGALSNGGNALGFLGRVLSLAPVEAWDEVLLGTKPDGHGLTVLPSLVAERDADLARVPGATLTGLQLDTTPEEIVRAWLESISFRVAAVSRRIEEVFGTATEVRASGGGLRGSAAWCQMQADALGRRVSLTQQREETSRGAALMTMRALGWVSDALPQPALAAEYQPVERVHAIYRSAMNRQQSLHQALRSAHPAATTGAGKSEEST